MHNNNEEMILRNERISNNKNSFPKYRITSDESGKKTSPINKRNNILNKINTKKSAPFSINFGQKQIQQENINYYSNNQNQDNLKQKRTNVFSHQAPLRYNRPFENKNFNLIINLIFIQSL